MAGDIILLYDGSFAGLLTAVFDAFDRYKGVLDILPEKGVQNVLFGDFILVQADDKKYERVQTGILNQLGEDALDVVYKAYLSEHEKHGIFILEYLKLAFRVGNQINYYFSDERVMRVLDLQRKVGHEAHKLSGFVRFKDIGGGVLYAEISPTYHVVMDVMQYFVDRMPGQRFIIYDAKRNIYGVYNGASIFFTDHIPFAARTMADVNVDYETLWKVFFRSIAIEERKSRKRQMMHMPKKYWKHIIEKMGEN